MGTPKPKRISAQTVSTGTRAVSAITTGLRWPQNHWINSMKATPEEIKPKRDMAGMSRTQGSMKRSRCPQATPPAAGAVPAPAD